MLPFREQLPYGYGIGKPAVEEKMLGLDSTCKGLGHHLDKDIGCLAFVCPVTPQRNLR